VLTVATGSRPNRRMELPGAARQQRVMSHYRGTVTPPAVGAPLRDGARSSCLSR
jgi:hypothetical protein